MMPISIDSMIIRGHSPRDYPWSLSISPKGGDIDSPDYMDACREYAFPTREAAEAYASQLSGFDAILGAWRVDGYYWLDSQHTGPAF